MNTNNLENTWWTLPQIGECRDSSVLAWAPAHIQNDGELLHRVLSHFESDKRVASVSLGYGPEASEMGPIRVHSPFGNAFFFNLQLSELVGPFKQDEDAIAEIQSWTNQATRRGLFHYWAAWWPVDVESEIQISRADAKESLDSLSPLGSVLSSYDGHPLSVLVDCAWLDKTETGSQRATVEILREMATDARIASISLYDLPNGIPTYASDLKASPKIKEIKLSSSRYSDILWRPYQPSGEIDFYEINRRARRIAFTYLDLISYSNDFYHESEDSWLGYRSSLRLAAIRCDGVIAISEDVRNQIIENMPLVSPERIYSVPLGTDHLSETNLSDGAQKNISGTSLKPKSYILCLGTNFAHKNRDFAIAVVEEVRRRGKDIDLVFAGLELKNNISGEDPERMNQLLKAPWIKTLGSVSAPERDWLVGNAAVAIYPTSAEGFGLVPFESAALGTPIVATSFGPLSELLSGQIPANNWTISDYAEAITAFLDSSTNSDEQVRGIRKVEQSLTWKSCASKMVDAFIQISEMEKSRANVASTEFESQLLVAQERFNKRVNAITSSFSWKLTAPVRAVHKKITGN